MSMKKNELNRYDRDHRLDQMDDVGRREFIRNVGLFLGLAGIPWLTRMETMGKLSRQILGSSDAFAQNPNAVRFLIMIPCFRGLNLGSIMGCQADGDTTRPAILKRKIHYTRERAVKIPGTHLPSVFSPEMSAFAQAWGTHTVGFFTDKTWANHSHLNGPLIFPSDPGITDFNTQMERDPYLSTSPNYANAFCAHHVNQGASLLVKKTFQLGVARNKRGQEFGSGVFNHVGNLGTAFSPLLVQSVAETSNLLTPPTISMRDNSTLNGSVFADMLRGIHQNVQANVLRLVRESNRAVFESTMNSSIDQLQIQLSSSLAPSTTQLNAMGVNIPNPVVGTIAGGQSTSALFETSFEQPAGQIGQGHIAQAGAFSVNLFKNKVTNSVIIPVDLGHGHQTNEHGSLYGAQQSPDGVILNIYEQKMATLVGTFLKGLMDELDATPDPFDPAMKLSQSTAILFIGDNLRGPKQDFTDGQVLSSAADVEEYGGMMGIFPTSVVNNGSYMDVRAVDGFNPLPLVYQNSSNTFTDPAFTTRRGEVIPLSNETQHIRNTLTKALGMSPSTFGVNDPTFISKAIK